MKGKESRASNILWRDGEKKVITSIEPDSLDPQEEIVFYRSAGVLGFLDSLLRGPEDYLRRVGGRDSDQINRGAGC